MKTTTFAIKGMHCNSCKIVLEGSFEDTDGVKSSEVNVEKALATVTFDEDLLSEDVLHQIVRDNGYEVI